MATPLFTLGIGTDRQQCRPRSDTPYCGIELGSDDDLVFYIPFNITGIKVISSRSKGDIIRIKRLQICAMKYCPVIS